MAEVTLTDVIERLKTEGQLIRNKGTNSIKSLKEVFSSALETQTNILQNMLDIMNDRAKAEENRERLDKAKKDIIEPSENDSGVKKIKESQEETSSILLLAFRSLKGLGLALAAIAASIGIAAGLVQGQVKALQAFFPKTTAAIINVFNNLVKSFTAVLTNFSNAFRSAVSAANIRIVEVFQNFGNWIRGLLSTASTGINRLGPVGRLLTSSIGSIVTMVQSISKTFIDATKTLATIVRTAGGITTGFSRIFNLLRSFGSAIANISRVVGRLFAPVAVIITLFDTVRGAIDGYAEGGILGGLEGAINGFFTSLITKPLDLIKDAVAWVIGKLGFDETADAIRSFSFTELFTDMTGAVFGYIRSAVDWVKTLFTDPVEALRQLWEAYVGVANSVADLLFMPINAAITWIRRKFGWSDEDAPAFSIREIIDEWVEDVKTWVRNIFSFLPSADDVRNMLLDALPTRLRNWISPDNDAPRLSEEQTQSRERLATDFNEFAGIGSFRQGTQGFMNFGAGTPAILHGMEAVVPRNTAAGEFLANNFTENWEPIMRRISGIEESALQQSAMAPIIIANAPTVAPINNNVRGPTSINNNRMTAIGNGSSGSGLGRFAN